MIEKVVSNDYDLSKTFNKFFANIVPNLKIISCENFVTTIQYETGNPVHNTIKKFKNYPCIKMITSKINPTETFSFFSVPHNEILNEIKNLNTKKEIQQICKDIFQQNC